MAEVVFVLIMLLVTIGLFMVLDADKHPHDCPGCPDCDDFNW